jgi:MPBQ/MSBQ methyltransferase
MTTAENSLMGYTLIGASVAGCALYAIIRLRTPSRPFHSTESVGNEYDKWAQAGILEHYWGEHIHLGYYSKANREWFNPKGSFIGSFVSATFAKMFVSTFKQSKFEFSENLMSWSGLLDDANTSRQQRFLDVGCGIGDTSRLVSRKCPRWSVTGISISPEQVKRAQELAISQGLDNVEFQCCDAMEMPFPDSSFDIVWSCESAEHMPDKEAFLRECFRVLKPGGRFVLATWCQRDDTSVPFTADEQSRLDFLYKEWCHPRFGSLEEYAQIADKQGLGDVQTADWTEPTLPAWRHSIFVGMWSPWAVVLKPSCWWSTIREIVTLERMHCAFRDNLMKYGILSGSKRS